MHFEIQYNPAHSLCTAHLSPGESVRAEASAMVSMSTSLQVETSTGPQGGGGFFKKIKRGMLGGESFFQNVYRASHEPAHVTLAPQLCGSMIVHELSGSEELLIQGSSYMAAPDSVDVDTKFQGFKGLFSGESLFFLKATGKGPVLMNAFGAIEVLDLDGEMIVDTGHLVAFTSGISYQVQKAGAGWIQAFLSGEGLVLKISGRGKLYLQSRNPNEFGKTVGSLLPARQG
jgi:uncharacterized protein (TIGR00266 family)